MSERKRETVKVAAAHAAPVFLGREAAIEKSRRLIHAAEETGAGFILFPEAFLPACPGWDWDVPPRENGLRGELTARPDVFRLTLYKGAPPMLTVKEQPAEIEPDASDWPAGSGKV